jgi:hypothetical protein
MGDEIVDRIKCTERTQLSTRIYSENLKERGHFGNPEINGRIILK